jgi:hypothetical protein
MNAFPTQRASALLTRPPERRYLICGLWSSQAVGIIGGEPKCGKSFVALDMAVSLAGAACLAHFPVPTPGRVLLFAAEDALDVVRQRLDGICADRSARLEDLDIHVITAPALRLDSHDHQARLADTVDALRPALLILDPFIRLHRIDENVSSEVAPLLAFLRELQRRFGTAVVIVHHARKGASHLRGGQALRGSSEFHAWTDSSLYLRRSTDGDISLTIEHRAEPSTGPFLLNLVQLDRRLALRALQTALPVKAVSAPTPSTAERVHATLAQLATPASFQTLRDACHIRSQTLSSALADLVRDGRVIRSQAGYQLPLP